MKQKGTVHYLIPTKRSALNGISTTERSGFGDSVQNRPLYGIIPDHQVLFYRIRYYKTGITMGVRKEFSINTNNEPRSN